MTTKRILLLLIVATMLISMSACAGQSTQATTTDTAATTAAATDSTGSTTAATDAASSLVSFEDLSFSWYINYDWYAATKWADTNEGEKWIKDNKKVDITFMDAGGAASQKLATMMVDNSYPDVITVDRGQDLQKLIAAGAVIPLDAYVDKYPNLRKWISESTRDMLKAPDGKLYVFPDWAIGENSLNGNAGWMYQKKYYEALGSPSLATFDDLYNYLVQVKTNYPDVLPMEIGANLDGFNNIFGGMKEGNNPGYAGSRVAVKDGKLVSYLEDESVQETLLFINKLYREKLISQDTFTMNSDQLKERIRSGKIGIMGLGDICSWTVENDAIAAEDPASGYIPIVPIVKAGVDEKNIAINSCNRLGWNVNCISKDAKDPEKIFAYLDWLFGNEGQLVAVYGAPGHYFEPDAYTAEGYPEKMTDAYYNAAPGEVDAIWMGSNWVGNTSFVDGMGRYLFKKDGKVNWVKETQIKYIWNHSVDATELSYLIPDFATNEGIIYQKLDSVYTQAIPEIVTAASEADAQAAILKYIDELKKEGLQTLLDYQTTVWSENMTKLGKN